MKALVSLRQQRRCDAIDLLVHFIPSMSACSQCSSVELRTLCNAPLAWLHANVLPPTPSPSPPPPSYVTWTDCCLRRRLVHRCCRQGPLALHLQSSSPPQATAGNMQSLAVLHWEATVQLRNPQGADTAGGSPPSFCVAVVTAGLSGKISVALMEGNIVPAWKKADSTIWHDAYGSVIAARIVVHYPTVSVSPKQHVA